MGWTGELFRSEEGYSGTYCPICKAYWEIDVETILGLVQKEIVTTIHTHFSWTIKCLYISIYIYMHVCVWFLNMCGYRSTIYIIHIWKDSTTHRISCYVGDVFSRGCSRLFSGIYVPINRHFCWFTGGVIGLFMRNTITNHSLDVEKRVRLRSRLNFISYLLRPDGISGTSYPRPVLAFRDCHHLRLWVCVCVCFNHELVRTITHRPVKLGSPNLDQRCKTPWFGTLLFLGMIDSDLQGQIQLESQILPHFELIHTITDQPFQLKSPKFGPKMHLSTVKIPTNFGIDWFWSELSFSILKPIFLPNLFAPFLYIFSETRRL